MPPAFKTPQDAEDAYYDAIDEGDLEAMRAVWADSPEIACLLPMQSLLQGAEVFTGWRQALDPKYRVEITVRHLRWIETAEIAIHLVEESVTLKGAGRPQPPIYATNVYRRDASGWRLLLHINSPAPPPPGLLPPLPGAPGGAPR